MSRRDSDDGGPLGPGEGVPRLSPNADWSKFLFDDRKGYVLGLVDGRTSIDTIRLICPFPREETEAILLELFGRGAIDIPGVERPPPPPELTHEAQQPALPGVVDPLSDGSTEPTVEPPSDTEAPQDDEGSGRSSDLSAQERRRIEHKLLVVNEDTLDDDAHAHAVLEVPLGADVGAVKNAYRQLSKVFHPDRHFRRNVGEYGPALQRIFTALKQAYDRLVREAPKKKSQASRDTGGSSSP